MITILNSEDGENDDEDDDDSRTCQRQAPTLRLRQSQRACSQQKTPELRNNDLKGWPGR